MKACMFYTCTDASQVISFDPSELCNQLCFNQVRLRRYHQKQSTFRYFLAPQRMICETIIPPTIYCWVISSDIWDGPHRGRPQGIYCQWLLLELYKAQSNQDLVRDRHDQNIKRRRNLHENDVLRWKDKYSTFTISSNTYHPGQRRRWREIKGREYPIQKILRSVAFELALKPARSSAFLGEDVMGATVPHEIAWYGCGIFCPEYGVTFCDSSTLPTWFESNWFSPDTRNKCSPTSCFTEAKLLYLRPSDASQPVVEVCDHVTKQALTNNCGRVRIYRIYRAVRQQANLDGRALWYSRWNIRRFCVVVYGAHNDVGVDS